MKVRQSLYIFLMFLGVTNYALAGVMDGIINANLANWGIDRHQSSSSLQITREQVVRQYIADLKKADYQDIGQLFDSNGRVISTSQGNVDAAEFFHAFLSEIEWASTELHQCFVSSTDPDRFGARFNFSFRLKNGESNNGEYVDEFVFSKGSAKLSTVYMFENLKFR